MATGPFAEGNAVQLTVRGHQTDALIRLLPFDWFWRESINLEQLGESLILTAFGLWNADNDSPFS